MTIQSVGVFCGSKKGTNPLYEAEAANLGKTLAAMQLRIVYGGGHKGLMAAMADAALQAGGKVTGVIPSLLVVWEQQHPGLTELIITDTIQQRKKMLYDLCDAAVILPGGYGTLDELFEMLTWNQLNIHTKKIFILNTAGFYTHLQAHLLHLHENGFLYSPPDANLIFCDTVEALAKLIGPG